MKTTKTIAALCAIGMVVSTMAMPVQAKTASKTETEIITMDTPTTTAKAKSKSKTTTKKSSSKATDEYKDFGKDLKVTVHNTTELTQAYLYANMMCAKSLKITFAKDYKITADDIQTEYLMQERLIKSGMMYGFCLCSGEDTYDEKNRTVISRDFGNVMSYFTYAYRTGDTKAVPEDYKDLYSQLSKGVDSCISGTNSITNVADNICTWLKNNSMGANKCEFSGALGKSKMKYTPDNKMLLDCEGYSSVFMIMMRMAGYTAYKVQGLVSGGGHCWNAIKVDDEYRYYDAGWTSTPDNMTYKEMIKAGYAPESYYRNARGMLDGKSKPTQKEVEALFIDWH